MNLEKLEKLQEIISHAKKLVFFGGAGVSTESSIPDFRSVDGLYQLAGSQKVYELHGSVHRNYCMYCGKTFDVNFILESKNIPHCDCGGIVKPDVVLYEESLPDKYESNNGSNRQPCVFKLLWNRFT